MIHFTPLRKRPALSALMLLILGSGFCQAQEMLTDSARKEATEWLKEVKSGYLNTSSARIQKAVTALTAATSTENAAMKLYVDAMKDRFLNPTSMMSRMLNRGGGGGFRMMRMPGSGGRGGSNGNSSKPDSPSTAFSNWRKQNTGNNVAPGFKKALQIQCKWMLLCLRKADAEKNERELNVSSSVLSMLDEVAANAKDVGEQLPMVGGASEVIRSYLNISDYRSDTLPDNLMDLNTIFDRVLLAPYKEKKDVENFRKLWNKRIGLEATLLQNNSASDKKTAEVEKASFLVKRQWEREKACFELGDQVAALEKMKSLISGIKDPAEKQRAIRDLEFLLLTPAEQAKLREERTNRRMPGGGPRFKQPSTAPISLSSPGAQRASGDFTFRRGASPGRRQFLLPGLEPCLAQAVNAHALNILIQMPGRAYAVPLPYMAAEHPHELAVHVGNVPLRSQADNIYVVPAQVQGGLPLPAHLLQLPLHGLQRKIPAAQRHDILPGPAPCLAENGLSRSQVVNGAAGHLDAEQGIRFTVHPFAQQAAGIRGKRLQIGLPHGGARL